MATRALNQSNRASERASNENNVELQRVSEAQSKSLKDKVRKIPDLAGSVLDITEADETVLLHTIQYSRSELLEMDKALESLTSDLIDTIRELAPDIFSR